MSGDRAEIAQLQRQLAEERARSQQLEQRVAQQAPSPHPAVTAGWQQADNTVKRIELEMRRVAQAANEAQSEGKFPEQIEYQRQLAALSNQKQAAEQHREGMVGLSRQHPLEQFLAANKGQYSAEDEQWIRLHPRFATDEGYRNACMSAHHEALADGHRQRSPAYYARLDGKAAALDGGAIAGPLPLLSGDMLDTAKSWYAAVSGKSYGATDEEVSRAWHEAGNSPNAHRKREEWALRDEARYGTRLRRGW